MRSSNPSAPSTNAGPSFSRAPRCAHSPPDSPPAQPVSGSPRGSRRQPSGQPVEPLGQLAHHRRVRALLRPEHAGGVLERRAHVAEHVHLHVTPASSSASSAPAPPSVVAEPPDRHDHPLGARLDRRDDQLARPARRGRPGVALLLGDEAEPARLRHLHDAPCRRPSMRAKRASTGPAERVADPRASPLAAAAWTAARRSSPRRRPPPAAPPPSRPAARSPRGDRGRHLGAPRTCP